MLFFLIHVHLGSTLRVCRPPPLSFFRNPPALHSHGKQPAVDEKLTSALRRQPSAFKTGDKLGPSLPPSAYRDIPPDRRHRLGSAHQDAFYIVRAQIGVGLQHQGDHAGADGCCHRCAGQADIMLTRFSGSSLSKSEPGTDKEMMSVPGA